MFTVFKKESFVRRKKCFVLIFQRLSLFRLSKLYLNETRRNINDILNHKAEHKRDTVDLTKLLNYPLLIG